MNLSEEKRNTKEARQRQRKELNLQKDLKFSHRERDLGLRYSVSFFYKYPPEEVEKNWNVTLKNLKFMLDEYEKHLAEKEKEK